MKGPEFHPMCFDWVKVVLLALPSMKCSLQVSPPNTQKKKKEEEEEEEECSEDTK
jgi:hypothetical protein